jgi:hypothetical protein
VDNFIIHRIKGIEKGHGFLTFECTKFDNFTYMIYDHCKSIFKCASIDGHDICPFICTICL